MIELSKKWAIASDDLNFILYMRCKAKGNADPDALGGWRVQGYYSNLHTLLIGLSNQEIRNTELASVKVVVAKIDELHAFIKTLPNASKMQVLLEEDNPKKVLSPEHIAKLQAGRKSKAK